MPRLKFKTCIPYEPAMMRFLLRIWRHQTPLSPTHMHTPFFLILNQPELKYKLGQPIQDKWIPWDWLKFTNIWDFDETCRPNDYSAPLLLLRSTRTREQQRLCAGYMVAIIVAPCCRNDGENPFLSSKQTSPAHLKE